MDRVNRLEILPTFKPDPPMTRLTRSVRTVAAACIFSPLLACAAPVAVNDSYALNEDGSLGTSGEALFSSGFEPGSNVLTGS